MAKLNISITKSKGKKEKKGLNPSKKKLNKKIVISQKSLGNKNSVQKWEITQLDENSTTLVTKSDEEIQKYENITDIDNDKDCEDDGDDDVNKIRQPTYYELKESEKPENTLNIITVRKKKKQKHQKNTEQKEKKSLEKEIEKNRDYLINWKNNRDKWKFEKLRQISIQSSIFNLNKISNDLWPIALEYLSGTKGSSKNNLIQLAEKQINELDNEFECTKNNAIFNDDRYKRARALLQIL